MDYINLFLVSFTIALSGAMAPGPLLTTVIYESTKHGVKTGPLVILGHGIIELAMLVILVCGMGRFINNPYILAVISLLGTVILIISGLQIIFSADRIIANESPNKKSSRHLPIAGITMSVSNPYWTVWWLTVGLGLLIRANRTGIIGILVFFSGHILADLGYYSFVSFAISKGRKFFSPRVYKNIVIICGISLIIFGIYFLKLVS